MPIILPEMFPYHKIAYGGQYKTDVEYHGDEHFGPEKRPVIC